MDVTINGKKHSMLGDRKMLDYGQVLSFADKPAGSTVTFRRALHGRSGDLMPGEHLWAIDGTVINVATTNAA